MRTKLVVAILGTILIFLGFSMIAPMLVAFYFKEYESLDIFLISAIVTIVSGIIIGWSIEKDIELHNHESAAVVALGWLLCAFYGSLPFILSGIAPIDAIFETMSGLTTTGSSVLPDVESLSLSLIFWRSLTQWLGGMGIIVTVIAILPRLAVAGRQMFEAEATGPTLDKLRPRLKNTARILWLTYVVFSLIGIILLKFAGMPVYDAIVHMFATISTGGFSSKNLSIAAYNSPAIEGVIILFMFIGGANFALFYKTISGDRTSLIRDKEFRYYSLIIFIATLLIAWELWLRDGNLITSARFALFQVVSILTTTGLASIDFNLWPDSAKMVLFLLMFIGGCAGSTAGAIKVVRTVLLLKQGYMELFRYIHPKAVKPIRMGEKIIPAEVMQAILSFFVLYVLIFVISTFILSTTGLDFITSMGASATTLGNVGPAFNLVGPMANFHDIPVIGKIALIANMWIGRLEVYTVLILFVPEFWKK